MLNSVGAGSSISPWPNRGSAATPFIPERDAAPCRLIVDLNYMIKSINIAVTTFPT
jgi:hypothetical protein